MHLLLTPHENNSISRCIKYLGRDYVRYFNRRYTRTDTLLEGRFKKYRALFTHQIEVELLTDIMMSANQGLALGSERFKDEIEAPDNRRQRLLKRGPKAKT